MGRFKDQVAVVTGAARGIGEATVRRFAREGARVAIFDIDEAKAEELAAALRDEGYEAGAWRVNVTDREAVTAAMAAVHARWGRLDILVNNAGIVRLSPFAEMSDDDWTLVVDIHLRGSFLCSQVAPTVHGAAAERPDHHDLQSWRPGLAGHRQLFRRKGRYTGAGPHAGPRTGQARHHGQHGGAELYRHRHDPHHGCPPRDPVRGERGAKRRRSRWAGWASRRTSRALSPFSPPTTPPT